MKGDDQSLSAAELDALVETIHATGEGRVVDVAPDGRRREVVRFDLVNSRAGADGRLPTLDIVHERFAGHLAEALGRLTGGQASVRPDSAVMLKFAESQASLPSPFAIMVLELTGLRGAGLMAMDPALLFYLLDVRLGGSPKGLTDPTAILAQRGLTSVEKRIFSGFVRTFADELSKAWEGVATFGASPIRAEIEPKHAAVFEASELVVQAVFQVEVAGVAGALRLVIPYSAIKPIEKKLASGLLDSGMDTPDAWMPLVAHCLKGVSVQCTAEFGRTTITLGELSGLTVGSVIRLDRDPDCELTVNVEGTPKFAGALSTSHGNFAVTLQRRLGPEDTEIRKESRP